MNGVFNIMSRTNTSYMGMAFNMVWYILHTFKAVDSSIPEQGSS